MDQRYFRTPFAEKGDRAAIALEKDPAGFVSYEEGWGPHYQLDPETEPAAKPVERDVTNALLYDITSAIKSWQEGAYPEFITAADNGGVPVLYAKGTIVRYRASETDAFQLVTSLVDGNSDVPFAAGVTSWAPVLSRRATDDEARAMASDVGAITPRTVKIAIQKYFDDAKVSQLIPGQIVPMMTQAPPPGTLLANGAAVSRTAYARLFAAIGTRFGEGDGSTTFNLPAFGDSMAILAAGSASAMGVTSGAVISHVHGLTIDPVPDHVHSAWTDQQGWHGHSGSTTVNGEHLHAMQENVVVDLGGAQGNIAYRGDASGARLWSGGGWRSPTSGAGNHNHGVSVDGNGQHGHGVGIGGAGAHGHPGAVHAAGAGANYAYGYKCLVCIAF